MRIIVECYAVYSAILITILNGVIAFGLSDNNVEWIAKKIINFSFIVFGPL